MKITEPVFAEDPDHQRDRINTAFTQVATDPEVLVDEVVESTGEEETEIFMAHAEFAADPELADRVHASIADAASADPAVRERVVVRTVDSVADKPLPFRNREEEDVLAMRLRGLRLGLAHPECCTTS